MLLLHCCAVVVVLLLCCCCFCVAVTGDVTVIVAFICRVKLEVSVVAPDPVVVIVVLLLCYCSRGVVFVLFLLLPLHVR